MLLTIQSHRVSHIKCDEVVLGWLSYVWGKITPHILVVNREICLTLHLLLAEGDDSQDVHTGVAKEFDRLALAVEGFVKLTIANLERTITLNVSIDVRVGRGCRVVILLPLTRLCDPENVQFDRLDCVAGAFGRHIYYLAS